MGSTGVRRPPAPAAAERARSAAARGGPAALVGTGSPVTQPRYHHVRADGSAVLLLAEDEPVLMRLRDGDGDADGGSPGEVAVMLEIADPAPVELRERVRGLLWITGRVREVPAETARRIAVGLAEVDANPGLLELGHTASMVRLQPGFAVLADAEGTSVLTPLDLAGARPDPFCRYEQHWLAHLEKAHPEVFTSLGRHLPEPLRTPDAVVRPLGVDRCGLRLRVERGEHDHDVRLAWEHPIGTMAELKQQMQRLVGCPFRGAGDSPAKADPTKADRTEAG